MEQLVAWFHKNARERVHITLREYMGHDLIDLRLFWTPDGGVTWNPSQKGLALNVEKLPILLAAIHKAAEMAGEEPIELTSDEEEILSPSERATLCGTFALDQERLEETIFE